MDIYICIYTPSYTNSLNAFHNLCNGSYCNQHLDGNTLLDPNHHIDIAKTIKQFLKSPNIIHWDSKRGPNMVPHITEYGSPQTRETPGNPFTLHLHISHCCIQLHKQKRWAWRAYVLALLQSQRPILGFRIMLLVLLPRNCGPLYQDLSLIVNLLLVL